ncbi:MAG TPA: phosphopantothenoylcysteine decarboxylase, partial [Phycisphaerae bacterium]|nr:phosphopantothenoylcysteine decarboxylase [Phycisphaerae bacterium]
MVTAGPTREKIDDVRDWGNIFSGKTGLDLALALLSLGSVTLLTSNVDHAREFDGYTGAGGMMGVETFRTHADLQALLAERMTSGDPVNVVAMTAAVADYRPAGVYSVLQKSELRDGRETWTVQHVGGGSGKVGSDHDQIAILGARTAKIVDMFRRDWHYQGILIKFKLQVGMTDEELLKIGEKSRVASDANLMVANTLAMARPGNAGDPGGAFLLDGTAPRRVPRANLAG